MRPPPVPDRLRGRGRGALAGWLLATLGAVVFGYRIAHDAPPFEAAGFALAAAGALTVFVGQARASAAFPRWLLIPIAGFILSLFLGARVCVPPGAPMSARAARCAEVPSAPRGR